MKMQVKEDPYDVGVIVGRFQVPELHEAHTSLIQHVCDQHDKVIVLLGLSPLMVTRENPLDYEARKQMILAKFPHVNVGYVNDLPTDKLWSRQLDKALGPLVTPAQSVVLYGGRDSFIEHYEGKYPTRELEQDVWVSGNEIRREVSRKSTKASADFRAGVVWAAYAQYPKVVPTVDVAIYSQDRKRILLVRKHNEQQYRLVGGFADPGGESYEADAIREVAEETGVEVTRPKYFGSFLSNDWRFAKEADKIKTLLFEATYQFGSPKPRDEEEIAECRWFDIADLALEQVVPTHRKMVQALVAIH